MKRRRFGRAALIGIVALLVPVSSAEAAPGTITQSDEAIDFGDQRVGTFSSDTVTFTFTGGTTTVSQVTVSGPNFLDFVFSSTTCEGSYDDGETCEVDVIFLPLDRGERTATVSLETDAASSPDTVALSGTGTVGYFIAGAAGGVAPFGDATDFGDMADKPLNAPVVGIATTPNGGGYWLAAQDGGIFDFGNSDFHGSMGGQPLNAPIVGIAAAPDGFGYWLVAEDGGVFAFGSAGFHGSMGGKPLNQPIVGIVASPSGAGYWLVALDGGIFAFGDADFFGSMGGKPLNEPMIGLDATPSGNGYHTVATDGGIFSFGDADFFGSMGGKPLNLPMIGIAEYPTGEGYWTVAIDGGVFAFGNAPFQGSLGKIGVNDIVDIAGTAPPVDLSVFGASAASSGSGGSRRLSGSAPALNPALRG